MNTPALITALHTLCAAPLHLGTQLSAAMALRLGSLCLAWFTALGALIHQNRDPRLVLAYAQLVEEFSAQVHHEQLATALDAEVAGAHALSLDTFDQLRAGNCDFDQPVQLAQGRSCYKSAGDLLAAWLGLNYFEAQRRIDDAHLLIGRRTAQGTVCAPRFPELARVYAADDAPRRSIAHTARRLAKLEPADRTFDGIPSELTARNTEGVLLDEYAAKTIAQLGPNAARKAINSSIAEYKETHAEALPPRLGLFIGPVVNGVHEFKLRTLATHAQLMHSVMVQAANWRTEAGKAAREADCEPTPSWLRAEQPPPAWAGPSATAPATAPSEEQPDIDAPVRALNAFMKILATPHTGSSSKPIIPRIIVYLWLRDLENLAEANAVTAHGIKLPAGELRRTLAEAKIIPVVLGGNSQPLDIGRARRFHEGYLRAGIMARDRGCIVPDCTSAPDHVEIDHYRQDWADGGGTSVQNGVALCVDGHHSRHVEQLKIVDVHGLPHVILPAHLDPEQKPRRNTYWGALQLGEDPTQKRRP